MNVSMHEVTVVDGRALSPVDEKIVGYATFQESGRPSTAELYFSGSEACQKAADTLARLAKQMRDQEEGLGERREAVS
jgi:hypothetical protein